MLSESLNIRVSFILLPNIKYNCILPALIFFFIDQLICFRKMSCMTFFDAATYDVKVPFYRFQFIFFAVKYWSVCKFPWMTMKSIVRCVRDPTQNAHSSQYKKYFPRLSNKCRIVCNFAVIIQFFVNRASANSNPDPNAILCIFKLFHLEYVSIVNHIQYLYFVNNKYV